MDLFGTKKRRARRELWMAKAQQLGGHHIEASGFWRRSNERIEVTVRGVPLVMEAYLVSSGKSQHPYTRVRGRYLHWPGPKLKVGKEGAFQVIGKLLGFEDHQLGHPHFDNSFTVKAESSALVRRMLIDEVREMMLARFRDATLTSDRDAIELVQYGHWDDAATIDAGLHLIATLVLRDLYGLGWLHAIEGGALSKDTDDWPRVELDTGVRVVIRAEIQGEQLVMVARVSERAPIASFEIAGGKLVDLATQMPQAAHVALVDVGTAKLIVDERGTSIVWPELEISATSLRAGAALLGALLATASDGAYR